MIKMESVINSIRDILRKDGITGMDSINHCILFLMNRILNEDLCNKFGIDKKFAFENIMKDKKNEIGDQDLKSRIFEKGSVNCFTGIMVNKFGFKNIKFKLESPQNLKLIYKQLEKLDTKKLESKYDLIGTIYELHLKSGTSNSLRDLGQYYTHRLVINYMIKLCDPSMKNGIIEKIVDPTMGTGGFLTMAIKYLNNKYKNKIDWNINKDNIFGFDIDDNVKNMAILNIFIEIGNLCDNTLCKQDTLHCDMKFNGGKFDNTILEKADIILANEPMGIKSLKYADFCERIKSLKINGTKAEPAFLQLFMSALNDNGRCAVIIPDGVLFNEANQYKNTRKYLIENFNLKKVIALNGDFFLNTGIKTSILFFAKEKNKTKEVDFCEIKLENGEIKENSIIKVTHDKIKNENYSLFVNKYNVKEPEKIGKFEYKKIGDICEFQKKSKRLASYGNDVGKYNFYTSSDKIKKCDEADYKDESIIIGTGGNANIKIDKMFCCSADNLIMTINNKIILIKYLYYYLLVNINILENGFAGSTIKHISKDYIENIKIPIPCNTVQKLIVEQLDVLNENIKSSKQIIDEYRKIIKSYIDCQIINEKTCLIKDKVEFIKTGKNQPKDKKTGKKYPYYGTSGITGYTDEYLFDGEYILTPRNGTIGQVFNVKGKIFPSDHVFVIKVNKEENIKYIYYYILYSVDLDSKKHGSTIPNITKKDIEDSVIKMPSKEKQKEIVEYCDNLTNLINKIEQQMTDNKNLMKKIVDSYLSQKNDNQKMKKAESEKKTYESDCESEDEKPKKKKVESDSESEDDKPKKKKVESENESEDDKPKKKKVESENESEDDKPKKKKVVKKVVKNNN